MKKLLFFSVLAAVVCLSVFYLTMANRAIPLPFEAGYRPAFSALIAGLFILLLALLLHGLGDNTGSLVCVSTITACAGFIAFYLFSGVYTCVTAADVKSLGDYGAFAFILSFMSAAVPTTVMLFVVLGVRIYRMDEVTKLSATVIALAELAAVFCGMAAISGYMLS